MKNALVLAALATLLLVGAALRVWYASGELHVHRFEDEQYSLKNVRKILFTGDLQPESGYYPSPVFNLPQVWLLRGGEAVAQALHRPDLDPIDDSGSLRPAAFLLTRFYQTVCGLATLVFVFLLGRRMAGPRAGMIAAAVLTFTPWMIHASGYNKPDALLTMAVAAALWLSVEAIGRNGPWFSLAAGSAIAVAMSAKLTGGLVALPLALGTALTGRTRRRWALLALAGATSALLFVALNPFWRAYLHFIRGLQRDYAGRTEDSRWQIPIRVIELVLDPLMFGPLLGTLSLFGLGLAVVGLVLGWRRLDSVPRVQAAMTLAFPLLYVPIYALQTTYFKPNNFLPIMPVLAVALGWLLDRSWRLAAGRWLGGEKAPGGGAASLLDLRRLIGGGAAIGLVVAIAPAGIDYVYGSQVPTTFDQAMAWLDAELEPPSGRLVWAETPAKPTRWEGARTFHGRLSVVRAADDLSAVDRALLERADGIILDLDRAGGATDWIDALEMGTAVTDDARLEVRRLEARVFRAHGPPRLAILQRRERAAVDRPTVVSCGPACIEAMLPNDLAPGDEISLYVFLPYRLLGDGEVPQLEVDGRPLEYHWAASQRGGHLFVAPRIALRADAGSRRARFERTEPFDLEALDSVAFEVHRWRQPAAP
ncbi:MAG: glycosyltransferase family 39 protein [Acidobacteriota bacterium]